MGLGNAIKQDVKLIKLKLKTEVDIKILTGIKNRIHTFHMNLSNDGETI